MRKVLFRKWIPAEYAKSDCEPKYLRGTLVEGTGCFSDYVEEGIFHQWATSYEEFEGGPGNYTTGLIEQKDGTVVEVLPTNIKFIEGIHLRVF